MPTNTSLPETSIAPSVPVWVIPIFGVVGLVSGMFTATFWWASLSRSDYLFEVLASSVLGLALISVLWFLRRIQSWTGASVILAATIAAHLAQQILDPFQGPDDSLASGAALRFLLVSSIIYCAALALVLRRRVFLRPLLIAAGISIMSAASIGLVVPAAHDHNWDLILNGVPLWPLWQVTLAFYFGVAVWVNDIGLRSSSSTQDDEAHRAGRPNRFAILFVLVACCVTIAIWANRSATKMQSASQQETENISAAIAQSNSQAPPMVALQQKQPIPVEQVLIMDTIGGWKPYLPGSRQQDGRLPSTGAAASPRHIVYSASYAQPNDDHSLDVQVTQYPNSDWARYELRNTPMPNERFNQSKQIQLINESGNKFYAEEMYRYWSSGDRLIFLRCDGVLPADIEKFVKAYLSRYPSSI
jgi:hypothetical protein